MHESDWIDHENRPGLESVRHLGVELRTGDRVRLWPKHSADIMDLILKGKIATIESIEQDFELNIHLSVVVDDDPGRDLGLLRQPGHRFFYSLDEVEPMDVPDTGHDMIDDDGRSDA